MERAGWGFESWRNGTVKMGRGTVYVKPAYEPASVEAVHSIHTSRLLSHMDTCNKKCKMTAEGNRDTPGPY